MSDYNDYRDEMDRFEEFDLLPAILRDPNRGFGEFNWKEGTGGWRSSIHSDGVSRNHDGPKTYLYKDTGCIFDPARDTKATHVVWWKVEKSGKKHDEVVRELADVYGLSSFLPIYSPSNDDNYHQIQEARESLHKETIALLWSDDNEEAREVLNYMRSRGWSDEEIKEAELGYIDEATRTKEKYDVLFKWEDDKGETQTQKSAGTTHRLLIPYRSGSRLLGFKLRNIHHDDKVEEEKKAKDPNYRKQDKYKNTKGLRKGTMLYGVPLTAKEVVVVEGDLDALHAKVKGFANIAGTAGSAVNDRQVIDALKRGITRFTLLFDNDVAGRNFLRPSIETIYKLSGADVEVRIATLPEGEGKDLDDYLKSHTIDEFETLLLHSTLACELKYIDIRDKYVMLKETQGKELAPQQQDDYKNECRDLINDPHTRDDRDRVFRLMKDNEEKLGFAVEDSYRDYVDQLYYQDKARARRQEVTSATSQVQDSLSRGDVDRALSIMRTTTENVQQQDKREEYTQVLSPSSINKMRQLAREYKGGVRTGYMFVDHDDPTKKVVLDLNEGLTFVSANTGHGKTSFLNNVTINVAKRNLHLQNDGSVLFFSYEVSKLQILAGLLNVFYNDPLISGDPQSSILSYLRGEGSENFYNTNSYFLHKGGTQYTDEEMARVKRERYNKFLQAVVTFDKMLRKESIIVAETSYSVEELVGAIKHYLKRRRPTLICIDYVQLMYSEKARGKQRHEELKEVVTQLKDLANTYHLPILLASQFNRDVESPIDLLNGNVGESGSIERVADTMIGLYNLKELHKLSGGDYKDNEELLKTLNHVGLRDNKGLLFVKDTLGPIDGKIFARLMKRRYGYYPIDTTLDWEGRTKYIEPNDPNYTLDNDEGHLHLDTMENYVDPDDDPLGKGNIEVQPPY